MSLYFLFFVNGLLIGSFLNVCIYRIPLRQSVVAGRSHCPCCGKTIASYDLIPVFSYLFLLGKCRYCKSKINLLYPLVELLTGILFLLCSMRYLETATAIIMCFVCCSLIILFFIDLKHSIIPDSLNIMLIFLSVLLFFTTSKAIGDSLLGAIIIALPVFIIAKLTNGFGEGDAFLFLSTGFLLGTSHIVLAAFISVVTGGLAATFLLLTRKKDLKSQMPFGPFIVLGVLVSLFFGTEIINWYLLR